MAFLGKAVVITGSSYGVGRFTAMEFVKQGANVLIHGRDPASLEETAVKCRTLSRNALVAKVTGDLSDYETLTKIRDTAVNQLGKINVIINNAAVVPFPYEMNDARFCNNFDKTIAVNLKAPLNLSQLCFPELQREKGNIVNISSAGGHRVIASVEMYCISKAALEMFTKCAAVNFGRKGVRVNAIRLGGVDYPTKAYRNFPTVETEEDHMNAIEFLKTQCPLDRLIPIEHVAKMIAFVASPHTSMLNGACIDFDGGLSLTGLDNKTLDMAAISKS